MNLKRRLRNLWNQYLKWTEIQAYGELRSMGGTSREEYLNKLDEIYERYEQKPRTGDKPQ